MTLQIDHEENANHEKNIVDDASPQRPHEDTASLAEESEVQSENRESRETDCKWISGLQTKIDLELRFRWRLLDIYFGGLTLPNLTNSSGVTVIKWRPMPVVPTAELLTR
jgi:hypothetical protein